MASGKRNRILSSLSTEFSHEWSGTYTLIKPHAAAIFQAKNSGDPNWAVQLTMNDNGDVLFAPRRRPAVVIAERMTGKPFRIRVRDNGHDICLRRHSG